RGAGRRDGRRGPGDRSAAPGGRRRVLLPREGLSGMSAMAEAQINPKAVTGLEAFELAAVRNAPLSVSTPGEQGKSPMARGRFLLPQDGSVLIENLQVPGRAVAIRKDQPIEAYFQHDGTVYQFRSRVL